MQQGGMHRFRLKATHLYRRYDEDAGSVLSLKVVRGTDGVKRRCITDGAENVGTAPESNEESLFRRFKKTVAYVAVASAVAGNNLVLEFDCPRCNRMILDVVHPVIDALVSSVGPKRSMKPRMVFLRVSVLR
jgi:hypothetical protein